MKKKSVWVIAILTILVIAIFVNVFNISFSSKNNHDAKPENSMNANLSTLFGDTENRVLDDATSVASPEDAAYALATVYLDDMMTESEQRTFTITKYRGLQVTLYQTEKMDVEMAKVYCLQPEEVSKDTWVVEVSVQYQYDGILSPIGHSPNQWIDVFSQGSPVGFLLERDKSTYTMHSRYLTANSGST